MKKQVRGVNPDTLEVETKDSTPYVFILQESGYWEGEQSGSIQVFKNFPDALASFKERVVDTVIDFNEWCDEEDSEQETNINEEEFKAHFEIYQQGNYSALHATVDVVKKEVM